MQSSTFAERATAAVSTLVAIAILGAAVTAQQASGPVADAVADFESDLRYQIDLALRHDGATHKAAHKAVDQMLAEWHASPQSAADRRILLDWFDAAISATMPGHSGKLPPQPEFTSAAPIIATRPQPSQPVKPQPELAEPTLEEPTPIAAETPEEQETPVSPIESAPSVIAFTEAAPTESDVTVAQAAVVEPPAPGSLPAEHSITIAPAHAGNSQSSTESVASVIESGTSETAPTEAPPVGSTPYEAPTQPTAVNVNLAELSARIEGYNQQLAEIEAAMVVDDGASGPRLAALVEQIEQLAPQYQFVKLYFDSLTSAERERVSEPRSLRETIAHASRLANREEEASDFLADFETADAAPTLTDRLQAIAEAAGLNQ